MKPLHAKQLRGKAIGLAIGERSLFAAEINADGQNVEARQLAEFIYPAGLSLDAPEALGKALGQFLREHRFRAHATMLGVPARWLIVRPKKVPPVNDDTVADLLRIQSEQEFSAEMDLVFDYASDRSGIVTKPTAMTPAAASAGAGASSRSVLLMATRRQQFNAVLKMAQSADLNVQAVTSSSAALGLMTVLRQSSSDLAGHSAVNSRLVLYLDRSGAELTMQQGGAPSLLRHLRFERAVPEKQSGIPSEKLAPDPSPPMDDSKTASLSPAVSPTLAWLSPAANGAPGDFFSSFVGELRRAVTSLPREAGGFDRLTTGGFDKFPSDKGDAGAKRELALWDSAGLDSDELRKLQDAVGFPVRGEKLSSIGVVAANGAASSESDRFGAAVALALCGLQAVMPVDFLHSRLAPRKKSRMGPAATWGAGCAAVIIGLIVLLYFYVHALQSDVDANNQSLADVQPGIKKVQQIKSKVEHASNWFVSSTEGQTPVTACLAEVTDLFPDSTESWATRFDMQRDNESPGFACTLSGKTSHSEMLSLPDSLKGKPHFSQVLLATNEVAREGHESHEGRENREGRDRQSEPQENFTLSFGYDVQAEAPRPPAGSKTGKE